MKKVETAGGSIEIKTFNAGMPIFAEGDPGDCAYVIRDGQVEISKADRVLGTLGRGELFGEMALVDEEPRMASAKAVTDTTVSIVRRDAFREKLAKADPFIRALLNIFVRNIRKLTSR